MPDLIDAASKIKHVTVYRAGALVTRRAEIAIGGRSGRVDVRIGDLPLLLQEESVRASLPSPTIAHVVDVHLELRLSSRGEPLDTKAQQDLREFLHTAYAAEVERQRHLERIRYLESLSPAIYKATDLPGKVAFAERHPVEAWLKLSGFVQEQLIAARSEVRLLDRRLEDLRDQIAEARNRIDRQSLSEAEVLALCRRATRMSIDLLAATPALEIELSYLVPAARWVPGYEFRVFDGQDRAELVLRADVAQRTGEDWQKAGMAFSTADLQRSARLPDLRSWRIGKAQPPKPSGWKELADTMGELFEGYDREVRPQFAQEIPGPKELPSMPRLSVDGEAAGESLFLDQILGESRIAGSQEAAKKIFRDVIAPAAVQSDVDFNKALEELKPKLSFAAGAPKAAGGLIGSLADAVSGAVHRKSGEVPRPIEPPPPAAMPPPDAESTLLVAPAAEPEVRGVAPGAGALEYHSLRMRGPEDAGARGHLSTESPLERLLGEVQAPEMAKAVRSVPARALEAPWEIGKAGLPLPPDAVAVEASAGHFAVIYHKENTGDVLADGQFHALPVLAMQSEIRRVYSCVPCLDANVYQFALLDNPLSLPLLAGPVRVYRGGDFVVKSGLDTTPPGKSIAVNLGVEPEIRVARNAQFKEHSAGVFGSGTTVEHRVEIEIRSLLPTPAQIEVLERIPVSHEKEIEVDMLNTDPKAEAYDQKDRGRLIEGGRKFTLDLAPGAKRKCILEYRITIPGKKTLEGGNRRD